MWSQFILSNGAKPDYQTHRRMALGLPTQPSYTVEFLFDSNNFGEKMKHIIVHESQFGILMKELNRNMMTHEPVSIRILEPLDFVSACDLSTMIFENKNIVDCDFIIVPETNIFVDGIRDVFIRQLDDILTERRENYHGSRYGFTLDLTMN